jgi:hypothetical protein
VGLAIVFWAFILTDPRTMPTAVCSVQPSDRTAAARVAHHAGGRGIRRRGALTKSKRVAMIRFIEGTPRPARGSWSRSPR